MAIHFQRAIDELKKNILSLGAAVEASVRDAVDAIVTRDCDLAQQCIIRDERIDDMEVKIEEECLKVLALHQPVAVDLRFLIAVLKINNDLERIADMAVNIAERTMFVAAQPHVSVPIDYQGMGVAAKRMLNDCLDALVNMDADLAEQVCASDDQIDQLNRQAFMHVEKHLQANPDDFQTLLHMLSASRHLERIGDLATNIAEDVIYMIRGDIVRHRGAPV